MIAVDTNMLVYAHREDSEWHAPGCRMIGEGPNYFTVLRREITDGNVAGPRVHDARVSAICLHHGVRELWTADRDFSRFPKLKCGNPLQA